jgi:hypothetical protein
VRRQFVIFARLTGGLGQVPFFIDIRRAADIPFEPFLCGGLRL